MISTCFLFLHSSIDTFIKQAKLSKMCTTQEKRECKDLADIANKSSAISIQSFCACIQ